MDRAGGYEACLIGYEACGRLLIRSDRLLMDVVAAPASARPCRLHRAGVGAGVMSACSA